MDNPHTILVTGGAGFIGSHFINHILKTKPNFNVVVLDALTYASSISSLLDNAGSADSPFADRFEFVYGNVRNAELVSSLVERSDYIVHFAAETHVTRSLTDSLEFFETDVLGTHSIANAVVKSPRPLKRLIHISTSEVYGTAEQPVMDESHPLKPTSPYASAKCGGDRLVYSYWATHHIPVTIVRPFNNFGPRQHLEKLIPRFITSALAGNEFIVHGDGSASRDFVFVEDVCRGLAAMLDAPAEAMDGEVFNLGTGVCRSIIQIAHDIADMMNYDRSKIQYIDDRPGQVQRHTGSFDKAERVLGWRPETNWEEGLMRTIDWYANNQDWWQKQLWMSSIVVRGASGKIQRY